MILLNFAHPITPDQQAQLEALAGVPVMRIMDVPTHIDHAVPLGPQVVELADSCGLSPHEWQTLPMVINPPGFAPIAVALIAEVHGRRGAFVPILRLRPVVSAPGTHFEVTEIVNVQALREVARTRRWTTEEAR
jgi:hypothetical protein